MHCHLSFCLGGFCLSLLSSRGVPGGREEEIDRTNPSVSCGVARSIGMYRNQQGHFSLSLSVSAPPCIEERLIIFLVCL